jgi:ubiquinone/menaquinone biosynthesis C-methylase UbiE/DNA-binding transcriptional ArsR family regulator
MDGVLNPQISSTVATNMDTMLAALRAVAEPTRLRLVALCGLGELSVTDLTQILGQSQPRVSRHLKLLVEGGVLERFREGTFAFYRLAAGGPGARLARQVLEGIAQDDPVLRLDRDRLQDIRGQRAALAQQYFDQNADRWDEIRSLHADDALVEAAVGRLVENRGGRHLLDIGTGTGRMLEVLGPHMQRAVGIDLSREMIALARAKLEQARLTHCSVRQGDMYQLPLPDASFDVVIIHQVLHYAEDPRRVVVEAARTLQPGGLLLLVDFARHEREELRVDHAHRRLGFEDREVAGWFAGVGLVALPPVPVVGDPLTVVVWPAVAPGIDGTVA